MGLHYGGARSGIEINMFQCFPHRSSLMTLIRLPKVVMVAPSHLTEELRTGSTQT